MRFNELLVAKTQRGGSYPRARTPVHLPSHTGTGDSAGHAHWAPKVS